MNRAQDVALIILRTLIGWHFLYEGFVKLLWPAWSRAGSPLPRWSSAGYLRSATGPFAEVFHALADVSWLPLLDLLVAWGLVLVGLSLMLGLLTQAGCVGALLLLSLFYLSWIPTRGVLEPGAEGYYLLVNKNLIEAAAVVVVLAFRTERIAGLDLLLARRTAVPVAEMER